MGAWHGEEATIQFGLPEIGGCSKWLDEVRARVAGQATGEWHDPHNNGIYTITDDKEGELHVQRLTGDKKYTDKMIFAYHDSEYGCELKSCSESQVTSIYDFSGNFCNLWMLNCGSDAGCVPVKHDSTMYTTESKRSAGATSRECDCFGTCGKTEVV